MEFRVLGPVQVRSRDGVVGLRGAKQRTLLAVLALQANRPVPGPRLLEMLWPDSAHPPTPARLHDQVHLLRRTLAGVGPDGSGRVLTRSGGYLLRVETGELDIARVERLILQARQDLAAGMADRAVAGFREALAMWRGPTLADAVPGSAERLAPQLDELRSSALEDRFDGELAIGQDVDLIPELTDLVAVHPLRERLRGQLMRALWRADRQAEALAVYRDGRQRMVDELGIEPGAALRDLHAAILRGDSALDRPGPRAAQAGARRTAWSLPPPAQLPTDLPDFTGYAGVVDGLVATLDPAGELPVVAVCGMAGIGKTSLAVRVGHRLRAGYPDAQLFADLRGADPRPADPADVLAAFLRALGVPPAAVPAEPAERTALYRSVLAPLRALILLDNARDAAQVRPLLPGAGRIAVVVTSRDRLADLPGAVHVTAGGFTDREARELLGRIVDPNRVVDDSDTARVLAACGGLPLAVRIAGARLAARPRWRMRDLAERLADRRRRLSELVVGDLGVRASFELSYAALPAAHALAFRLLAVPDLAEVSSWAAATLLGLPRARAAATAEALVDAHLLSSAGPDRYRLHDLLRDFALAVGRSPDPEGERAAALGRLVDAYRERTRCVTVAAQPGYLPGAEDCGQFPDEKAARAWLDSEIRGIVAVVGQAAAAPDPDTRAIGDILHHVQWYLRACGYWVDWQRMAEAVWRAALRAGDQPTELVARQHLGQLAAMRADVTEAQVHLTAALDLASELDDRRAEAATLVRLGLLAYVRNDLVGSLDRHRAALRIFTALDDRRGACGELVNVAKCLTSLGRPAEAAPELATGLALASELGDPGRHAMLLHQHGRCLAALGRHAEAVAAHRECLAATRRLGNREGEAYTLGELGNTLLAARRPRAALDSLYEAVRVFRELGDDYAGAIFLAQVGHAHRALGAESAARSAWRDALDGLVNIDAPAAGRLRGLLREPAPVSAHPPVRSHHVNDRTTHPAP